MQPEVKVTWSTAADSARMARQILDDSTRALGDVAYELALHGLVRSGYTNSHRVLSAAFLNMHDELLTLRVAGAIQVE